MNPRPQGLKGATLRYGVRGEIAAMIGVLFLVYVVFDLVSTRWLASNTSVGIAGEINPVGLALYRSFGYGGMISTKMAAFAIISGAMIFLDGRYRSVTWFRQVDESILLCLVGISSIAALVNFGGVVTVLYHRGQLQALSPWVNLSSLALILGFAYMPGRLRRFRGSLKILAAVVGTIILTSPVLYFRNVFVVALQQVPVALVAYAAAAFSLVAGVIHIMDKFWSKGNTNPAGMNAGATQVLGRTEADSGADSTSLFSLSSRPRGHPTAPRGGKPLTSGGLFVFSELRSRLRPARIHSRT